MLNKKSWCEKIGGLRGFSAVSLFPSFSRYFNYMDRLWNVSCEIISSITKIEASSSSELCYKGIAWMTTGKCLKSFLAIEHLIKLGFHQDTLVLLRSMLESMINLFYISEDPVERAERFVRYVEVESRRFLYVSKEVYGEISLLSGHDSRIKEIEEAVCSFKSEYDPDSRKPSTWSGITIFDMAKRAGLEDIYKTFYKLQSQHVHGSPRALESYIEDRQEGLALVLVPDQREESLYMNIIMHACYVLICVVDKLEDAFNKEEKEIAPLMEECKELFKGIGVRASQVSPE
jgi:hypothetical protein